MSDPDRPTAPTPSPFDDSSPTGPGGPRSKGPARPLLIGCGVILVLLAIALAVFFAYQDSIAAWVFEALEAELEPRLPEDLPEDVRARYEAAFDRAIAAAREGDYDPQDLQRVQQELGRLLQGDESDVSQEDVERLTGILEDVPD